MKRLLVFAFAAFALCQAGGPAAALSAGVQRPPPRAQWLPARAQAPPPRDDLMGFVCQRALDPPARAVAVVAVMRPLPGTKRMALRFQLGVKSRPKGRFAAVSGGDLGRWISPANPGLGQRPGDVWKVDKQVVDLAGPALYRFRIKYRWTGAHGRVLGESTRVSESCFQPERRPDLLVQSIGVTRVPAGAGNPARDLYVVAIRNQGATAAGPFEVKLTGGSLVELRNVQGLAAHSTRTGRFLGPICAPGAPLTVTVDPDHLIDDVHPANNSLTAKCPGPGGR